MCDTLALRCHEVSQGVIEVSQGVIEVPPLSKGRLGGDCAKQSFGSIYFSQPLPSSPCHKERLHLSPKSSLLMSEDLTAPARRSYTKVGGASKPSPLVLFNWHILFPLYNGLGM